MDTATERDLGDWTDREMFLAIHEAVGAHVTVTETGRVLRGSCGLCDDAWKTNPRGTEEGVVQDVIRHAVDTHAALVRKRIRDIQRRERIAAES
jgi:hypothetical protein